MTSETLLTILTYVGTTITAFYGIYATLTDFHKTDNAKVGLQKKHRFRFTKQTNDTQQKKILTKQGKWGIVILILSFLLTMITSIIGDHKKDEEKITAQKIEREKRDSDIVRINRIIDDLSLQLKLTRKQTEISDTVSQRTNNISTRLELTTKSISNTAQLSKQLYVETRNAIGRMKLQIVFTFDPLKIIDDPRFNFSADTKEKMHLKKLPSLNDWANISSEIQNDYSHFKDVVLKDWLVQLVFSDDTKSWIRYGGTYLGIEGLSQFQITNPSFYETEINGRWGIPCTATYEFQIDNTSNIIKYVDLNNLRWETSVIVLNYTGSENDQPMDLEKILLDCKGSDLKSSFLVLRRKDKPVKRSQIFDTLPFQGFFEKSFDKTSQMIWHIGNLKIPRNFFKNL